MLTSSPLLPTQSKNRFDVTKELGGENYVFWGGREGYMSLLNTDLAREQDHFGRFLQHGRRLRQEHRLHGQFLIEPKPCEPTKHQYDYDTCTVLGFLRKYNLAKHFKDEHRSQPRHLGWSRVAHELEFAVRINDALGSNRCQPW